MSRDQRMCRRAVVCAAATVSAASGWAFAQVDFPAGGAHRVFSGVMAGDHFGAAVVGIPDIDLDGRPDVAVGAYFDTSGGPGAGRVVMYSSNTGLFAGEFQGGMNDWVGYSLAMRGQEIIVGAPCHSTPFDASGRVYVTTAAGADFDVLDPLNPFAFEYYGSAVASAGDLTGDGIEEYLVGAFSVEDEGAQFTGRARVHHGVTGAQLQLFSGEGAGDKFGFAVAGIGRNNADMTPDIAIGAPRNDGVGTNVGRVYLRSGSDWSLIRAINGPSEFSLFGESIAPMGDLDGDGRGDFAVGAPGANSVLIYSGATAGLAGSVIRTLTPPDGPGLFGRRMANIGDVDGDGVNDLVIGAPDWSSTVGRVYVFSTASGRLLYTVTGELQGTDFGNAVAGAGDVNMDGRADILIGAQNFVSARGRAYLVLSPVIAPLCPADFNGDGQVNSSDLATLLANWGNAGVGDLNASGSVNSSDLAQLLAAWGPC